MNWGELRWVGTAEVQEPVHLEAHRELLASKAKTGGVCREREKLSVCVVYVCVHGWVGETSSFERQRLSLRLSLSGQQAQGQPGLQETVPEIITIKRKAKGVQEA